MFDDVARLRALRNVAEQRSFSRAAEELGYTQSAISQQIAALEQEVGLTLLNRGVRPVTLTDAGRLLVEHAERVLEQLATAAAQLEAIRGLHAGRLRMSAFPSALATFVPTAVAQFRSRHPDVRVELVEAEPDTSLPALRAGEVDLAITYELGETAGRADEGLDLVPLLDDEQRAVLPSRHRLASRKSVSLANLAGEPWIVPRADGSAGGYRQLLEDLCTEAGFAPQIAFETDDLQAVQAFVGAGLGIALMHDLTLPVLRRSVAVRPLAGRPLTRRVSALTAAGRRSPAAAAMLEVLAE
jgi:DNA-binding transcriptional LysR family regulator